jgi:hypothetical protein
MIKRLNKLPEGFLNCPAEDLHRIIPDSTLIPLEGKRKQPLFCQYCYMATSLLVLLSRRTY